LPKVFKILIESIKNQCRKHQKSLSKALTFFAKVSQILAERINNIGESIKHPCRRHQKSMPKASKILAQSMKNPGQKYTKS